MSFHSAVRQRVYGGIDLGGTFVKYGLVDADGRISFGSQSPTPSGREAILGELARITHELLTIAARQGTVLRSIGIGSPGIVDVDRGKIIGRSPNLPGWEGTEVGKMLSGASGLVVRVDNDANVMALAEHRLGAGKGFSSGLYVTVGTGIGSGIVQDNRLWRGAGFAGAELGHTIIVKNGKRCKCGKHGCLELYANSAAFLGYYGKRLSEQDGVKMLFDRAKAGDGKAIAAVNKAADYLACGIGSALELLNPQVVVIGGGIALGGRIYLDAVRRQLPLYTSRAAMERLRLMRARLGNHAGLIGAALASAEIE